MTLEQLFDKIGKQSLTSTRNTNAKIVLSDKEYVITDVKYQNGKWVHMVVEPVDLINTNA